MNGDMQSIRQKLSEAQNLLGTIHELLPPEQPAPARPPLPECPYGYRFKVEDGKEAYRLVQRGESYLTEVGSVRVSTESARPVLPHFIVEPIYAALPPLPDLSGRPGFALHMEGGKPEIRKPELEKDWFWEYDMPVRRLFGSVPPLVYILDYFPPPDVPPAERWWDAQSKKWWTVEEMYGKRLADLPILADRVVSDFRISTAEDEWLSRSLGFYPPTGKGRTAVPVLILRPKPQPRELRMVECLPGEYSSFRYNGVPYRVAEGPNV